METTTNIKYTRKCCQTLGCPKKAASPTLFCVACGGGKRCQTLGCLKAADKNTLFCIACGGGKRCQTTDCSKSAARPALFCIACGGGKRCQTTGCPKSAIKPTLFCVACGGGTRCQTPTCTKIARRPSLFCKACGGGTRCQTTGCPKSAVDSFLFCKACGGGRRCQTRGCPKSARSNTLFCTACGGGRRCNTQGCPKSAIDTYLFCKACGGGNRCSRCALYSVEKKGTECFDCRSRGAKFDENGNMVGRYLSATLDATFTLRDEKYVGNDLNNRGLIPSHSDEAMPCADTRRRPDFTYVLPDRVVVVEVDENYHRNYVKECELARISELSTGTGGLPLFVVRFNPMKDLLDQLASIVTEHLERKVDDNTPMINVEFIGYPTSATYDTCAGITEMAVKRRRIN